MIVPSRVIECVVLYNDVVDNASTLPTDVPTLRLMLRAQQQLIESLKANLFRLVKRPLGPKSDALDVDQFGLFADASLVIEVPAPPTHGADQYMVSKASFRRMIERSYLPL